MKKLKSLALTLSLFLSLFQTGLAATTADILFIVDESGSMSAEHTWIGNMVTTLDSGLNAAGVSGNRYGLIGYGAYTSHGLTGHSHTVGGGLFGSAAELVTATGSLTASGVTEDGYEAMNFAFSNYSFRPTAAVNVILITDEDRDIVDAALNRAGILGLFTARNALLNAIVDVTLQDGNLDYALGVDADSNAYTPDGMGGYNTSGGGTAMSGFGTTINDYVDLAFSTGGAVWDLNQLRNGGLTADAFTQAFIDIKVGEITSQQPAAIPLPTAWLLMLPGLGSLAFFTKRTT